MKSLKVASMIWILFYMAIGTGAADTVKGGPLLIVEEFLAASKEGNIPKIKMLIDGPYYQRRKALLEENSGYSRYLINAFKGVQIRVAEMRERKRDGSVLAVLEIHLEKGNTVESKLILRKDRFGSWKIFDEILD